MGDGSEERRWHEALRYALTGERDPALAGQRVPDLDAVLAILTSEGSEPWRDEVRQRAEVGEIWPHPVPEDLMTGIGAAQFSAALGVLRARLGLDAVTRSVRVSRDVGPSSGDERLLREVPPHHGPG